MKSSNSWRGWAIVMGVLASFTFAAGANGYPDTALTGLWKGSLQDDGPSVELTVFKQNDRLSGKIVFPMVKNGQVVKRDEHELINSSFDGQSLTFKVQRSQGDSGVMRFALKLLSSDRAELRDMDTNDQGLEMTKQKTD